MNEKRALSYHGEGGALLWLTIRCLFLTSITLGIYWPWAKARLLRFHYENTSFGGSSFGFQGTGKEMFIGMLKGIGILTLVLLPYIAATIIGTQLSLSGQTTLGSIIVLVGFFLYFGLLIVVMPLAVNSSLRYRFGRTSWRSIRWAYRGKNRELLPLFIKGILLTAVTLGIYSSWLQARFASYIYSKLHFGSVRFRFKGEGFDLFMISLKGILLSIVTLGIYFFWYMKNLYKWTYENIIVIQGEKSSPLVSTMTGGQVLKLNLINGLLLVFTLGIATPWVTIRNIKFLMEHVSVTEDLNLDTIEQVPAADVDATGDDLVDFLDLGDWGIL